MASRATSARPSDLDHTDLALLARAGRGCRAAVLASGLPRTWVNEDYLTRPEGLRVSKFVTSVALLKWAREHGRALQTELFPAQPDCLLIVYQFTRAHWRHRYRDIMLFVYSWQGKSFVPATTYHMRYPV